MEKNFVLRNPIDVKGSDMGTCFNILKLFSISDERSNEIEKELIKIKGGLNTNPAKTIEAIYEIAKDANELGWLMLGMGRSL